LGQRHGLTTFLIGISRQPQSVGNLDAGSSDPFETTVEPLNTPLINRVPRLIVGLGDP
jgi:hypothetical protein